MRMGIGLGIGINRSNYAQGIFSAYQSRVIADGGITEAGNCVNAVSSLLQSASLLLIPSGYKGGKLYAEIPTNGNGDLTWTRGSDAFRTNASGVLQRVPWNLLQYSEQFDNAYWLKSATVTSNTTISPNGNQDADTFTDNSTSYQEVRTPNITIIANSTYTASVFIKKTTGALTYYPGIAILVSSVSTKTDFGIVNTTTGQIVRDASSSINSATYSTQSVGDYWRVIVTFTDNQSNVNCAIYLYPAISSNGTSISPTAQGSNVFWGAQLVEGTTAQTYLPTTDRLNFPRLSYMYGSCPSALLEPQRTNLALYSEQFNDATWVKSQSSITANSTTSPDGNTTADTFTGDGNLAQHFVYQNNSLTSGVVYTMSVYAKKNTNDFLQITAGSFLFGVNAFANFNLNNGTIGTVGSSATATITSVGNGWYRCTMTATATTTGSGLSALYTLISSSTSARAEINSLATSLYLWGAQLEQGAYPTTYIPTTSATATRVADSFSRNNIYTNGLISASGGTWFVELRNNIGYARDVSSSGLYIDTSNSALTNGFAIRNPSSAAGNQLMITKVVSGVLTPLYSPTTSTAKIAIKWNGTNADIFVNGTKEVSATSFTPTAMEFLNALGSDVPKFIQSMALYPTPLTDTQCQTLTTL